MKSTEFGRRGGGGAHIENKDFILIQDREPSSKLKSNGMFLPTNIHEFTHSGVNMKYKWSLCNSNTSLYFSFLYQKRLALMTIFYLGPHHHWRSAKGQDKIIFFNLLNSVK